MTERGKYIVLEGGEGSGKSTQAKLLFDWMINLGVPCYLGREPGGVPAAEEMRTILKNPEYHISSIGEVFGFAFARAEFFDQVVMPNLNNGINVISDRSGFSTEAIQGYGGGVPLEQIKYINKIAMRNIRPDLAILIDIDPVIGLKREIESCRISQKGLEFHKRVRMGHLKICRENPDIYHLIYYRENDAEGMQDEIRTHVKRLFNL